MVGLLFSIVFSLIVIERASADTISEMLKLIPGLPQVRNERPIDARDWVYIVDYAQISKLFTIPPDRTTYAREIDGIVGRSGPSHPLSGISSVPIAAISKEHIGFDPQDVDASILAGTRPDHYELIRGRIHSSAIESAIKNCNNCPEVTREMYEGCTIYDWGKDPYRGNLSLRHLPPAYDSVGRLRPIGTQMAFVFRAPFPADIKRICETTTGKQPSLLDQSDFAQLAKGMATLGVYNVLLKGSPPSNLKQENIQHPLLRPYKAYGVGEGKDNNGKYIALVLVHANEMTAWENAKLLPQRIAGTSSNLTKRPYKELVSSAEIRAGGKMLLAKFRTPQDWGSWLDDTWLIMFEGAF
jgi:hypothetical protein